MAVVNTWEVHGTKVPKPFERVLKVCMSPEEGSTKDFTLIVSLISPRSSTSYHSHDEGGELMFVVTGRGSVTVEGKDRPIGADTAIFAPLGVRHRLVNDSDETMKVICVFVPPLPPRYVERVIREEASNEGKGRS
ncbi:MAG TPA: cupin domain-containing protein [Candidatus Methanomethylicus sp.]|nr:cupin domain-containing protein [Candidatus Methanomethylicus sp.]HRR54566.1 cupin domain-containing protein [Candidatus Methanomethylicus sp.]HRU81761.1 cupin domain-containing protein [Candidatus Methanomethylicus sp.]